MRAIKQLFDMTRKGGRATDGSRIPRVQGAKPELSPHKRGSESAVRG
jgi:hypothetical protein